MTDAFKVTKFTQIRIREDLENIRKKKSETKSHQDILNFFGYNTSIYDEEVIKIGYNYCDDEVIFEKEIKNYLEKKNKPVLLEKVTIVVEFFSDIAKERFKKTHEQAITKICLKRTKSSIYSSPNMKYYELVPIINRTDTFRPWQENHLNDQLKIWLTLENNQDFPSCWITNEQTKTSFNNNIPINANSNLNESKISLEDFLEIKIRLSGDSFTRVKTFLDEKCISTVEELANFDEDSWKNFSQHLPSISSKIRNEIGKLIDNKNSLFPNEHVEKEKSKAEKIADWHKTQRFLYYEAEMDEFKELGYLSKEALDLALEEQSKSTNFNGGPILSQIKNAFEVFTLKPNDNVVLSHGMLMYGPPGTGKTTLINVIIKKVGLKELVTPFASTELNRGIVGETERLIRDIIRRGLTFPYLLCCVAIDEIDAIVPKREGSNSNQRIDSLTQFLTLIGGVDDVKNVYIIGATNRFNKIDDAFLRRLGDKFYVGNLRKEERFQILEDIQKMSSVKLSIRLLHDYKELIQVLTTNFSGAAISALRSHMLQYIEMTKSDSNKLEKQQFIEIDKLVDLIDKCAASFKVKFGGLTLAELIKSTQSKDSDSYNLNIVKKEWLEYRENLENSTGRVLIDLSQDVLSMQFELKNGELFELDLKEKIANIRFLTDIIPLILFLCVELGIEYVKFIDTHFKILQGAEEKSSTLNLILDCFTDFDNYDNGLLCFDGDTIIGVNDSGKIEDALTGELSQSINDQDVWKNCVLHIFRTIVQYSKNQEHPWCILSTSHKFLIDSFKSALKFPLTKKEQDDQKKDKENREKERECKNCKKIYYEKDNGLESCSYHSDHLVNLKGDLSVRITNQELIEISRTQKSSEIFKDYAWYCCIKGLDSEGCKKNKHSDELDRKIVQNLKSKEKLNFENEFYSIESIHLKSHLSVSVDGDSVTFSSGTDKEHFKLIEFDQDHNYLIKSLSTGKYLTADRTTRVIYLNEYCKENKVASIFKIVRFNKELNLYGITSCLMNEHLIIHQENGKLNIGGPVRSEDVRIFSIKQSNTMIDPADDESIYIDLQHNVYSIQSILNYRYISVENGGYSFLKAENYTVENEKALFQFIPVANNLSNKKNLFLLRSIATKMYVSLNYESKKLTAIEKNSTNAYALYSINLLEFDKSLCSISIGNKYISNKKSSMEKIKTLNVDAEYLNETEIFRINNQNSFLFFICGGINYIKESYRSQITKGYFHIKVEKEGTYIYLNKIENNKLCLRKDHTKYKENEKKEVFKFFKDTNDKYEIKAKSNDLFICISQNGELNANSNDSLTNTKFEIMHEPSTNLFSIKSTTVANYLDYNKDKNNFVANSSFENIIFKIEPANIFSSKSTDIIQTLKNSVFRIQSTVNNEYITLDTKTNQLTTSSNTCQPIKFHSLMNDRCMIKVLDKFVVIKNDRLELDYESGMFFQIKVICFHPSLMICLKSSTNKFVRVDLSDEKKYLKVDAIDVDETEIFRIIKPPLHINN